jgi:hypothetical protein
MHVDAHTVLAVAAVIVFVIDAWQRKSLQSVGLAILSAVLLFV